MHPLQKIADDLTAERKRLTEELVVLVAKHTALTARCDEVEATLGELAAYLSWQDSLDPAVEPLQPVDVG